MAALDDLNALLAPLPGYDVLTESMKVHALNRALIPDGAGVWPGQPAYQTTYDIYWAALSLLGFLQAQPVIRQSSSEGTSVAVDAPSWTAVAMYYREQSHIASTTAGDILTVVPIPGGPHVVPTDMRSRGGGYGDVDTDLS